MSYNLESYEMKFTEKDCKAAQRRATDHWGERHPYKGKPPYNPPDGYGAFNSTLPDGWVWVEIPTWGSHIRKVGDEDWRNDLSWRVKP